jgi:predicted TIM-barrel fold metal-dependent hydrolase
VLASPWSLIAPFYRTEQVADDGYGVTMTYVGDRVVFDADSHVMELPGWLEEFADDATATALRPLALGGAGALADRAVADAAARRAGGVAMLDADPARLLRSKGWDAVGAFDATERSFVLDQLGFAAQLVFPTFAATQFAGRDLDVLYGGTDALNRAMAAFCAGDTRLLAVASVPWGDPRRTIAAARRALDEGCAAVMVPSDLPKGVVSPTHPDHHPLWSLLEAENVPVVTHIGGGGRAVRAGFHDNGHTVTDFLGGGENIRAKDFMAIHQRPEVFWAAMVLDGVFERFPGLRGASVEEGAMWVVPWVRRLDRALQFAKTETPLRELSKLPSEYVSDHLRFTPFAGEPVGWMVEQAGAELFMFSSDYPHPEGTKDPVQRFESTMDACDDVTLDGFYRANFEALYRGEVPGVTRGVRHHE